MGDLLVHLFGDDYKLGFTWMYPQFRLVSFPWKTNGSCPFNGKFRRGVGDDEDGWAADGQHAILWHKGAGGCFPIKGIVHQSSSVHFCRDLYSHLINNKDKDSQYETDDHSSYSHIPCLDYGTLCLNMAHVMYCIGFVLKDAGMPHFEARLISWWP